MTCLRMILLWCIIMFEARPIRGRISSSHVYNTENCIRFQIANKHINSLPRIVMQKHIQIVIIIACVCHRSRVPNYVTAFDIFCVI